ATLRAYRADWADFTAWCADRGLSPLPAAPETVARYLTDLAGVKATATLQRRITSISQAHQAGGHEPPTRSALASDVARDPAHVRRRPGPQGTAACQRHPGPRRHTGHVAAGRDPGPGPARGRFGRRLPPLRARGARRRRRRRDRR